MSFLELVQKRQSCRSYLARPVERDKLEYCLEAARFAPSACNAQPWTFVVIDEPELRQAVAKKTFGRLLSFNQFSLEAPVLAVIVSERQNLSAKIGDVVKNKSFSQMDVAIAAEHFCLAAAEQGLGTCMLGWFDETAVKRVLGIAGRKHVELIVTLGYPAEDSIRPKKRKPVEQFRSFNRYA